LVRLKLPVNSEGIDRIEQEGTAPNRGGMAHPRRRDRHTGFCILARDALRAR